MYKSPFSKKLNKISIQNNIVSAMCGTSLYQLNKQLINCNLSGLEWSYGIPGSVGGAVKMNAGSFGGEIKDVVFETTYIDEDLQVKTTTEHEFSYRKSIYSGVF